MRAWFACEPGLSLARAEFAFAAEVLPNRFGYHVFQLDNPYGTPLIACSRIQHQVIVAADAYGAGAALRAKADALPIVSSSLDVLVLPHVLEFASRPHAVLREAERVLIPEGCLFVLGFSPHSLFGMWRLLGGWRGTMPWSGRFLGLARLRDWLALLGFEIERVERLSFRPPLRRGRVHAKIEFVERLGKHFWPVFGNVYGIVARKRVVAVRPIRAAWARQRRLSTAGVIEPTTCESLARETGE